MPGLSQLKKFSSDLLALGDETNLRASRGEKPVTIEIPKDVEDKNDSEEFVLGMPINEAEEEVAPAEDDLSDLTSLINPGAAAETKGEAAPAPSFEAPDMSALLNPVAPPADDDSGMPDLSMFDEPEEEPEEVVEEEPEEISIADMGLDALLAGGGFDEPQEEEESYEEEEESTEPVESEPETAEPVEDFSLDDMPSLDDLGSSDMSQPFDDIPSLDDTENLEDVAPLDEAAPLDDIASFDEPSPLDDAAPLDETAPLDDTASFDEPAPLDDTSSFDEPAPLDDTSSFDEPAPFDEANPVDETAPLDDAASSTEGLDSFDLDSMSLDDMPSLDSTETEIPAEDSQPFALEPVTENKQDDFEDGGSFDLPDDMSAETPATDEESQAAPAGLFDTGDFDLSAEEEIPDFDATTGLDDSAAFDDEASASETEAGDENAPLEVFDTSDMEGMDFGIQDTDSQLGGGEGDFEFGQNDDFAMEGEFEIPGFSDVTTAKEEKSAKPALASGKEKGKKSKGKGKDKNLPEPDFSQAVESEELPPNTLSDEQYKTFLANLAEYPLNVRLAFEDFIVQDEFTDDAEFELIEKILNKAPARQVAGMLEKMLDTSIPIPRDFEHRTAAEYEAYKKSLSYQLRNKIIPGILLGLVLMIVGWGLFKFGDYCIYRPLKANSLYKQGYA